MVKWLLRSVTVFMETALSTLCMSPRDPDQVREPTDRERLGEHSRSERGVGLSLFSLPLGFGCTYIYFLNLFILSLNCYIHFNFERLGKTNTRLREFGYRIAFTFLEEKL